MRFSPQTEIASCKGANDLHMLTQEYQLLGEIGLLKSFNHPFITVV